MATEPKQLPQFTREEVAQCNTKDKCWIIINSRVYDVTKFMRFHPGGEYALLEYAGKDATKVFFDLHKIEVLKKYQHFIVGTVKGEDKQVAAPQFVKEGTLSTVPYSESPGMMGLKNPYYKESHYRFAKAIREFVDKLQPELQRLDDNGTEPSLELYQKLGQFGLIGARVGCKGALKWCPNGLPGGVKPEEYDYFHEQIAHEQIARLVLPGVTDGISAGYLIGFAPLFYFGSKDLVEKHAPAVIRGDKRICLALTEAFVGSDLANLETTAKLSECGKFYIVNGHKKWITNGTFCDYFVTAVRTGSQKDGAKGVSLLFIERSEGVKTGKIVTSYSPAAGTAYITFDNVRVPVENLLGKENQGFKCIMFNFNHERAAISMGQIACNRRIIEDTFKWAVQRQAFGKPLIAQPVIRATLANMIERNESAAAWVDAITYQMCNMTFEEQNKFLGGPIALCKSHTTKVSYLIGGDATQIFGGRALTKTGMGSAVNKFQTAIKYSAILGGAESTLDELGVKQSLKFFPKGPAAKL